MIVLVGCLRWGTCRYNRLPVQPCVPSIRATGGPPSLGSPLRKAETELWTACSLIIPPPLPEMMVKWNNRWHFFNRSFWDDSLSFRAFFFFFFIQKTFLSLLSIGSVWLGLICFGLGSFCRGKLRRAFWRGTVGGRTDIYTLVVFWDGPQFWWLEVEKQRRVVLRLILRFWCSLLVGLRV